MEGEILAAQIFLEPEHIHFHISPYNDGKLSIGMKHFIDRAKFNNSELTHVSRSGLIVDTGTSDIFCYFTTVIIAFLVKLVTPDDDERD